MTFINEFIRNMSLGDGERNIQCTKAQPMSTLYIEKKHAAESERYKTASGFFSITILELAIMFYFSLWVDYKL